MPEIEELYPEKLANLELEATRERIAVEAMAAPKNEYRDPRKPALPFQIEEDPEHVLVSQDGSLRAHYNYYYDDVDVARLRAGICCVVCGESQAGHEGSFPEKCWVCGFAMKEKQAEVVAKEFRGNVRIGPQTSYEDEIAAAEEIYEFEERQARGETRTQIWVP